MSLLLDTHVVLRWLTDDSPLTAEVKDWLDHEPAVHISPATIWKVAIKQSLGKFDKPVPEAGFGAFADRGRRVH
jgi:PIN domain nuclease of toxin-antitoxin system